MWMGGAEHGSSPCASTDSFLENPVTDNDPNPGDHPLTVNMDRPMQEALALARISRTVSESEKLDDLYAQVDECARRFVAVDRVVVMLADPATGELQSDFESGSPGEQPIRSTAEPGKSQIPDQIRESGAPAKYDDIPGLLDRFPGVDDLVESGLNSAIYAPITLRGDVIGVIGVLSQVRSAYTDEDLDLLVRISHQIAGSVANTLTQRQMEREIQEQEILAEIGHSASLSLNLNDALDSVFEKLDTLMAADRVVVMVQPGSPGYIYERGVQIDSRGDSSLRQPAPNGLPVLVAESGQSRLENDLTQVLDEAPGTERIVNSGLNSAILAPLISDAEVVGVLAVCALKQGAYSSHDLQLLERLALLLTGTIINTQLHAAVEQQARHEALLSEVGRVATSTPELETVLGRISELLSSIADFDGLSLSTVDEIRGTMIVRFVAGAEITGFGVGDEILLDGSHTGEVLDSRTAVIATGEELQELGERIPHLGAFVRLNDIRTRMVVPILHGDEAVGVLSIHSRYPSAYSLLHLNLVKQVAAQISGAIANALLRADLAQTADEEEILAEISRVVTSSPDFKDASGEIADLIARRLQFDRIAIGRLDIENGITHTIFAAGLPVDGFATGDTRELSAEVLDTNHIRGDGEIFQAEQLLQEIGPDTEAPALAAGLITGISVHLRSRGANVGNISVRSTEEDAFQQRDLDFMRRVAAQLSGAFANSELHAEVEERAREETILARIGREIGSPLDTENALRRIMSDLGHLVPTDRASIAVRDEESGKLEFLYLSGVSVSTGYGEHNISPTRNSAAEYAMNSGEPYVLNDIDGLDEVMPGVRNLLESGLHSVIEMPLVWDGATIGVLGLSSTDSFAYDTHSVELVRRVGEQLAGWVVNAQLLGSLERQAKINAAMAEIGREAGSSLELDRSLDDLITRLEELLPVDRVLLATSGARDSHLETVYSRGVDVSTGHGEEKNSPTPGGILSHVFETATSIVSNDTEELIERYVGAQDLPDAGIQSMIGVPLIWEGDTVGVFAIGAKSAGVYDPGDRELVERIAQHITGAVVNSELHKRAEQRATEEALLAAIGRLVNSSVDMEDVYEQFASLAVQLVPADRILVATVEEGQTFRERYLYGPRVPGRGTGEGLPLAGSLTGQIVDTGRSQIWPDDEAADEMLKSLPLLQPVTDGGIKAYLTVPLSIHGEVFGALHFSSLAERRYSNRDRDNAEAVANQIAGAIVGMQLRDQTSRRAREESTIAEIGRMVSASLDFGRVIEHLAESLNELVPYDRFVVFGLDEEAGLVFTHFVVGREVEGWAAGTAHALDDLKPEAREVPPGGVRSQTNDPSDPLNMVLQRAGLNSYASAPLIWEDRTVGAISVRSEREHAFMEHDQELLARVAQQITGMFVNAELHAITARESAERSALAEIGRLVSSSLDVEEMFEAITGPITELIPYDRLAVTTHDSRSDDWITRFVSGLGLEGYEPGERRSSPDRSALRTALEGRRPFITGNDESRIDEFAISQGVLSSIHIPLTVGGELIGELTVRSKARDFYGQKHLELARRIGDQIAGSVANAELHAITEREAEERLVLAEIGRLVSSSLNAQEIFESIAEPFNRLIPFDRFSVSTYDSPTETWTPRYVDGPVVGGYEIGETHADNSDYGRRTARDKEPWIVTGEENTVGATLLDRFSEVGLRSALLIPLIVNGEVVGALSARSFEPNTYTERQIELSKRIALLVGGAVVNSELHRALEYAEAQSRAVVETAAVGIVTADETLVILSVNEAVIEMFGFSREELIGRHVSALASEPYRGEHLTYEKRYHETGDPRIIGILREVVGQRKDGSSFPMELEVSRVDLDEATTYTGVMRDITARKQAEQQLAELTADLERRVSERTQQLQETNTELEAFSYTVSHDLRGPLTMSARLAARLLELDKTALPESSRQYVELIARSSQESSQLVTDLLNFARLGHQALTIEDVDPAAIAEAVTSELAESNPHINWTHNPMPPCGADENLLRLVYMNLLSNAAKFTSSRTDPEIEIGAIELEDGHAYYVRDNGVGFDMDLSERMFDVFERLHRPEDYPGTGAGLAIVRRIIERHGGRVWGESEPDKGATFFFTLPTEALLPIAG